MFKKISFNIPKKEKNENFSEKVLNAFYEKGNAISIQEKKLLLSKNNPNNQNATDNQTNFPTERKNRSNPIIISIGGGKGGIGKSFLTANIAVRLANLGFKVSAVDLDLGAANLHTCLGVPTPQKGVSDFFHGEMETLEEAGIETNIPNLTLYGGNQDFWQHVKPQGSQKIKLINYLQALDSDYVFIDLGAGTHVHTLDFFIFSDAGLLVVVPEPTSIENAYVFMKSVLFRKIQNVCRAFNIHEKIETELLQSLLKPTINTTPFDELTKFISQNSGLDNEIIDIIKATNIGIMMNQVRTQEDRDLGLSMSSICSQYFGFSSQFLGAMRYDDSAWKSIRIRKPLIIDYPHSVASTNIYQITDKIIQTYEPLRENLNFLKSS